MRRAEDWRFGSLWAREHGRGELKALLSAWPVARPRDWARKVNDPLTPKEREAIQVGLAPNRPYGDARWQRRMVATLSLEHTVRPEGGPRKPPQTEADA